MQRLAPNSYGACVSYSIIIATNARYYTRGMPYTPEGTIQDFTSSPMHAKLAEMQKDLDKRSGREETGLYRGPTITTPHGARPLFADAPEPGRQGNYTAMRAQRQNQNQNLATSRAPPSSATPRPPGSFIPPTPGDNFQQDIRVDPAFADVPEHIRAAKQAMLNMQSDSAGQVVRGLVPPPPPLPNAFDVPHPYKQPRVPLDDRYWYFIWAIVGFFIVLGYFGR